MKIVLIALLFGICQAKPQSLEFFEKTQETFGDEFQEKAMDYITGIDEAFHGKQTGKKYMPLKYRTRSIWHFQFLKPNIRINSTYFELYTDKNFQFSWI